MIDAEILIVCADGQLGHLGNAQISFIPPVGYIFAEHRWGKDNWYQVTEVMSRMRRDENDVREPITSCSVTLARIEKR